MRATSRCRCGPSDTTPNTTLYVLYSNDYVSDRQAASIQLPALLSNYTVSIPMLQGFNQVNFYMVNATEQTSPYLNFGLDNITFNTTT